MSHFFDIFLAGFSKSCLLWHIFCGAAAAAAAAARLQYYNLKLWSVIIVVAFFFTIFWHIFVGANFKLWSVIIFFISPLLFWQISLSYFWWTTRCWEQNCNITFWNFKVLLFFVIFRLTFLTYFWRSRKKIAILMFETLKGYFCCKIFYTLLLVSLTLFCRDQNCNITIWNFEVL